MSLPALAETGAEPVVQPVVAPWGQILQWAVSIGATCPDGCVQVAAKSRDDCQFEPTELARLLGAAGAVAVTVSEAGHVGYMGDAARFAA